MRPLLLALAAAAAAGCAGPRHALPPLPPGIDPAHLHFEAPRVRVGEAAPDFTLPTSRGDATLTLAGLRGRPVVLVFGSYT